MYKCKCSGCNSGAVVLTYSSEAIDSIVINSDGSLIFACPPYEDNDLTLRDIKEDVKRVKEFDVIFTCYDCEVQVDSEIVIDGEKYTDAMKAFLKIMHNLI